MTRDEMKKEVDRQLEVPVEAPEPRSIYDRAMNGEVDEEELRKLLDAPSEFESVRQDLLVEQFTKARIERRCPRCMALLMPTGLPEGKCPNDCPQS